MGAISGGRGINESLHMVLVKPVSQKCLCPFIKVADVFTLSDCQLFDWDAHNHLFMRLPFLREGDSNRGDVTIGTLLYLPILSFHYNSINFLFYFYPKVL